MEDEDCLDKRKRIKNIGKNISRGILWGIIVLCISVWVLYLAGIKTYFVRSGSMEPEIHTGSICIVNTHKAYEKIKIGDIVAYQSALGIPVTHRVIRITEAGFETKGDANDLSDGIAVTPQNYLGQTCFSVP